MSTAAKALISQNRRTHGLAGRFTLLAWEDAAAFSQLADALHSEHQPATDTELRLVESAAQHYWLMQRALHLQDRLLQSPELDHRTFALYLRYQTTNERAFYRALHELRVMRKEKRREEVDLETQKQRQEIHEARVRLTHARAAESEIETEVRSTMEAPIPGHARIPFEDMTNAFRVTLRNLNKDLASELTKSSAA